MTDWEEKLPPIARERLARIGQITPEQRERMKDQEQLAAVLAEFFKGELSAEGLWARLKEYKAQGKQHLLREAQLRLLESLTLGSTPLEVQKRKEGILAVEMLKDQPNTATLEQSLNAVEELQKREQDELEQASSSLRARFEMNPQLRMQPVKQGDQTVMMQLTADEAMNMSPEWRNFLARHDRQYSQGFADLIEQLKAQVD